MPRRRGTPRPARSARASAASSSPCCTSHASWIAPRRRSMPRCSTPGSTSVRNARCIACCPSMRNSRAARSAPQSRLCRPGAAITTCRYVPGDGPLLGIHAGGMVRGVPRAVSDARRGARLAEGGVRPSGLVRGRPAKLEELYELAHRSIALPVAVDSVAIETFRLQLAHSGGWPGCVRPLRSAPTRCSRTERTSSGSARGQASRRSWPW